MIHKTLVVLGIGALIAGFAPIAQAQSGKPSQSDSNSVTLSGASLRTVENRSIADDYQRFFIGRQPVTGDYSEGNVGSLTDTPSKPLINDQLEVVVGDTLNSQNNPTSFSPAGELGDTQRVKVQVQLGQ